MNYTGLWRLCVLAEHKFALSDAHQLAFLSCSWMDAQFALDNAFMFSRLARTSQRPTASVAVHFPQHRWAKPTLPFLS